VGFFRLNAQNFRICLAPGEKQIPDGNYRPKSKVKNRAGFCGSHPSLWFGLEKARTAAGYRSWVPVDAVTVQIHQTFAISLPFAANLSMTVCGCKVLGTLGLGGRTDKRG
jgi:hypothetical protein